MRSIQETQLMKFDGAWEDIQFGMTVQIEEGVPGILKSVKFTQDVLESLSDEEESEPKPGSSTALKIGNLGKNHESQWYCKACDIRFPKEKKYLGHIRNHSFCYFCGKLVFNLDEDPKDLACDNCAHIRNREEALRNGKTDTMGSTNPTRKTKRSDESPSCFVCSMILENADATLDPKYIICENCAAMESGDQCDVPMKGNTKGSLSASSQECLKPLVILEEKSEPKPGPSTAPKIGNPGKNHESQWHCTTCDIRFPMEMEYLRHITNHSMCYICGQLVFNLDEEPKDLACDNCAHIRNREEALRNGKTDTMGSTNPTRKRTRIDESPSCFVCSMILENTDATLDPKDIICENCAAMASDDQCDVPMKGNTKGSLTASSEEGLKPLVILEEKSEPKPGPSTAPKIGNPGKNHESQWHCTTCDIRFPMEKEYLRHIMNHSKCYICGQFVLHLDEECEDLLCDNCAQLCKLDDGLQNGKTKLVGITDEPPICFVCSMILENADATLDPHDIICENCAAEESDDQSDIPMKRRTEGSLSASLEEDPLGILEESDDEVEIKLPSCCMCSKILETNLNQGGKQVCEDCIQACLMGVIHGKGAKVDKSAEESSQQSTKTERVTGESDVEVEMISDDPDMDVDEEEPEDDFDVYDWSHMNNTR